ncbi:MAG: DUF1127 domain-containing protein [Amaricoccus sp.]
MTTRIALHAAHLPTAIPTGIVEYVTDAVRARLERMKRRHDCRTLLDCDAHLLHDIGVSRADLEAELRDATR